MTPTLSELRLYRCLADREGKVPKALAGVLHPIADDVSPLLEYNRLALPSYTGHGIEHSLRVLERIGAILRPEALAALSDYELFAMILAGLLHDVGIALLYSGTPDASVHHAKHADASSSFVDDYLRSRAGVIYNKRLAELIAFAVLSHGLSWEEMKISPTFERNETIDGQIVRARIISILLRVGDLLDLAEDRTNDLCLQYLPRWGASQESLRHHERHQLVRHFTYNSDLIEVEVECRNREHSNIWQQWLHYLKQDILQANTYVFRDALAAFQLPRPVTTITTSSDADFELWELRFEIDDDGKLWDVISTSIYTSRFDFIRETLSNAIDACLRRIYDDPTSSARHPAPRGWALRGFRPAVNVVFSEKLQTLLITDNGVGMARDQLEQFLFRIASSGGRALRGDRAFPFPSIGTFGLGFISVLTRASRITVVTRRHPSVTGQDGVGYAIQMNPNFREAPVQKAACRGPGTCIIVQMKEWCSEAEVSSYVVSNFLHPSVSLFVLKWDTFVAAAAQHAGTRKPRSSAHADWDMLWADMLSKTSNVDDVRQAVLRTWSHLRRATLKNPKRLALPREPFFEVPAAAPAKPPLDSPIMIVLDRKGVPARVASIDREKTNLCSLFGIVLVPVYIDDRQRGIEWSSLHAFLTYDTRVCRQISFNIKVLGSDDDLDDDDDDTIIASDERLNQQEFIRRLQDRIDNRVLDLVDYMELQRKWRENRLEGDYGMQDIRCDVLELSRESIALSSGSSHDDDDREWETRTKDLFDSGWLHQLPRGAYGLIGKAVDWYLEGTQTVCQDGIVLPLQLVDLIACGATVGKANLLADARLALNVSRTTISEVTEHVKRWRSSAGEFLWTQIITTVRNALNTAGLEYKPADLFFPTTESRYAFNKHSWKWG